MAQRHDSIPHDGHDAGVHAADRERLRAAMHAGLIGAVFQPIVDLRCGEVSAMECLARPLAGSGFANVSELFAAAERVGAMWELESATRRAVFAASAGWPQHVSVTTNSSPSVFADARFVAEITDAVDATPGLRPSRVVLEITERAETEHADGLMRNVRTLKDLGFQIAVDDVGAGSSGLNRIMAMRPQWLKLDRELVDRLDQDSYRQNLIRFFAHFARLGGARLVAEGIERVEDLGVLIDLGVMLGQGYLLGKPGPRDQSTPTEIAAWIRERAALRERIRRRDPRSRPLSDIMRAVIAVDGASSVADAAAQALHDLHAPGVAVLAGRRYVGWVGREALQRAACATPLEPLDRLTSTGGSAVEHDTPLGEVIAVVAARPDDSLADPVVVTKDGEVVGLAPMREVLRALAVGPVGAGGHTAPLTGLPDRSACDQQVAQMIAARAPGDVMFIDVRGLSSFNNSAGYDMGDLLIQHVAAVIESVVRTESGEGQAWHLGDDRFLALAPAGRVSGVIEELLLQFERTRVRVMTGGGASGPTPALRVLVIPDAFQRVGCSTELHRLADQLRRAAHTTGDGSQVIVDRRVWDRDVRLSA